ncbi:MAG: T9SS type A sorting domain-containing protein, partial [Saprospiraceae bacterium]
SSLCFKVLRRWTVIDWCNGYYDSLTMQQKFATWEHLQIIKVANKNPPKIQEDCDTIIRCLNDNNCFSTRIKITHSAGDDCTPDDLIRSKFKLDLYNDGRIDSIYSVSGNVITWDGELPLGIHRFIWVFEDQCGNEIVCDQIVRIINCKIPTAYCLTGIAVNLGLTDINADGILEKLVDVWAPDINHGSGQQCGNPVTLSFSRDSSDKFRRYTCDSLGQRRVELWVTDRITGFQDRCVSTISIQDNNKICGGNIISGKISGLIKTPDGRPIASTIINIEDQLNQYEKTFSSSYSFDNLLLGRDYKIKVKNDQNYLEGISTLDILKIQKHILGKTTFENVWQYLAADVTNDEKITSGDISALRKLILGVDYKFKNSMSWKYIISNYQFPDQENPWIEALPSTYYYPSIPGDMNYTDFTGVKVGDVSQSTWGTFNKIENRTTQAITMYGQIVGEKTIQVFTNDEVALQGMQFTLKFNSDLNTINRMNRAAFNLDESNANYQYAQNGIVLVSWNTDLPINTKKNGCLFSIEFDQLVSKEFLESLEINSDILSAEAYNGQENVLDIRWSGNNPLSSEIDLQIGSPVPNPFYNVTTIVLDARKNVDYKYQITDIDGHIIIAQEGYALQGKNYIKIKGSSLLNPGIYLVRIEAAGSTKSFKLIKMDN